ncbi:MAG TPA: right-handed parallel beta-helix repeat-containing protein, partial [bacterium]|nr:right-handed parallel beta-helix repeat-containing protein [bacterium]
AFPSISPAKVVRVEDPKKFQLTVDSAAYGDSVLVPPGVYPRVLLRPGIRLISEKGPEQTTLRNERMYVVKAEDADSLNVVEGFTLDGVKACEAVVDVQNSTLVIRNCIIKGGWAGIRTKFTTLRSENCRISKCQRGYFLEETKGDILETDIRGCNTGIQLVSASPRILRSTITGNSLGIDVTEHSDPSIGGSIATANRIYGNPGGAIKNSANLKRDGLRTLDPMTLHVPYNFWGSNCPDSLAFRGPIVWSPWVDESAKKSIERCALATAK